MEPTAAAGEAAPTNLHVRTYLLADVSHAAPGQEFSVGLRFDIDPTWHIYWRNPGETGLATKVTFSGPEGFELGELRYPAPKRFESLDGTVTYGYEELALLSAPVIAPDAAKPGDRISFKTKATWLACREACIQGSSENELKIEIASPSAPAKQTHAELWQAQSAKLPRMASELQDLKQTWKTTSRETVLVLRVPGASRLEYYPSAAEQEIITGQAALPSATDTALHISYKTSAAAPKHAAGVLRVEAKGVRYYQLHILWPDAAPKSVARGSGIRP